MSEVNFDFSGFVLRLAGMLDGVCERIFLGVDVKQVTIYFCKGDQRYEVVMGMHLVADASQDSVKCVLDQIVNLVVNRSPFTSENGGADE